MLNQLSHGSLSFRLKTFDRGALGLLSEFRRQRSHASTLECSKTADAIHGQYQRIHLLLQLVSLVMWGQFSFLNSNPWKPSLASRSCALGLPWIRLPANPNSRYLRTCPRRGQKSDVALT